MITGTPVVATTLAAEGLDLKNGQNVLIADSSSGLAQSTIKLLKDKELQKQFAKAGEMIVKESYSWDTIAKELDKVYKEFKH